MPAHRYPAQVGDRTERPARLDMPEPPDRTEKPAQSSIIAAELGEMEPPPRRDFEVVHKPARRRTTPNFQVERRTLPRRS
jgi:hypothetical protein